MIKKNQGVTLILAVFISFIALALGVGISTLVLGEIGISRTAKESIVAFYAADSGAECALYWDIKQGAFSTTTTNVIECAGQTKTVGGDFVSNFELCLPDAASCRSCARIRVDKSGSKTTMTSLGENVSCGVSSERSVQRGLEVTY